MQKWLILTGLMLLLLGILWPLIQKFGFGRLPGDIQIEKEGFSFFFPVVSSLILSALLSLLFWLFRK
ncbi:MAG: DUF2905 domain-containing protein [Gammaproteobacteria bacterium]|nr:DUF2905 domain-containing protein [Gammaproteobacteria bacterium]